MIRKYVLLTLPIHVKMILQLLIHPEESLGLLWVKLSLFLHVSLAFKFFLFSRIHPNELLTEHDELMTCLFVRIFPFDKTVNIFILCHTAKYIIEVCNTTKICFCYPFVRILDLKQDFDSSRYFVKVFV